MAENRAALPRHSDTPHVWHCEGCGSWTDRPVTEAELISKWFWTATEIDGYPAKLCPECT